MRTFDIYSNRKPFSAEPERIEVVKDGFSWPACLFVVLWMLFKQMWAFALVFMLLGLVFFEIQLLLGEPNFPFMYDSINLVIQIFVGVNGNHWLRGTLERRGFERIGRVEAATASAALQIHLEERRLAP